MPGDRTKDQSALPAVLLRKSEEELSKAKPLPEDEIRRALERARLERAATEGSPTATPPSPRILYR